MKIACKSYYLLWTDQEQNISFPFPISTSVPYITCYHGPVKRSPGRYMRISIIQIIFQNNFEQLRKSIIHSALGIHRLNDPYKICRLLDFRLFYSRSLKTINCQWLQWRYTSKLETILKISNFSDNHHCFDDQWCAMNQDHDCDLKDGKTWHCSTTDHQCRCFCDHNHGHCKWYVHKSTTMPTFIQRKCALQKCVIKHLKCGTVLK